MWLRTILLLSLCLCLAGCQDRAEPPAPSAPAAKKMAQPGPTPDDAPSAPGAAPSSAGGVKYVPRVSEAKLQEYLAGLSQEAQDAVTEEQVFAIMGPPTRRDPPITGQRNGQPFTLYEAYWEEPESGVQSSIPFVNGRLAGGMVLGLESRKP